MFQNLLQLLTTSYLDSRHDGHFIVTKAITIFHTSIPFGNPISIRVGLLSYMPEAHQLVSTTSSSDAPAICTTSSTSFEEFPHSSFFATSYSEIQSNSVYPQHTSVSTASKFISPFHILYLFVPPSDLTTSIDSPPGTLMAEVSLQSADPNSRDGEFSIATTDDLFILRECLTLICQ